MNQNVTSKMNFRGQYFLYFIFYVRLCDALLDVNVMINEHLLHHLTFRLYS